MNSKFKIGDRVIVIAGPRTGAVTTVTGDLTLAEFHRIDGSGFEIRYVHDLDLGKGPFGWSIAAPPAWLRHYYDGNEKADDVDEWISNLCTSKTKENT